MSGSTTAVILPSPVSLGPWGDPGWRCSGAIQLVSDGPDWLHADTSVPGRVREDDPGWASLVLRDDVSGRAEDIAAMVLAMVGVEGWEHDLGPSWGPVEDRGRLEGGLRTRIMEAASQIKLGVVHTHGADPVGLGTDVLEQLRALGFHVEEFAPRSGAAGNPGEGVRFEEPLHMSEKSERNLHTWALSHWDFEQEMAVVEGSDLFTSSDLKWVTDWYSDLRDADFTGREVEYHSQAFSYIVLAGLWLEGRLATPDGPPSEGVALGVGRLLQMVAQQWRLGPDPMQHLLSAGAAVQTERVLLRLLEGGPSPLVVPKDDDLMWVRFNGTPLRALHGTLIGEATALAELAGMSTELIPVVGGARPGVVMQLPVAARGLLDQAKRFDDELEVLGEPGTRTVRADILHLLSREQLRSGQGVTP